MKSNSHMDNVVKFEVHSEMKSLSLVRSRLEDTASQCGFSSDDIYQLKVAVSEAVANAIEHGSPRGPEDTVELTFECGPEKIVIEVADKGVFKARLPVTDGRPSHRGRGIFLMTALTDEVNIFEYQTGTVVRLVKYKESAKE